MNDEEIIQSVLEGKVNAFNLLIEKYQNRLVGTVFNMIRGHQMSEDLG